MPISGYEHARQPIPLDHLRRQVEREKAEVEELGRRRSRRSAGGSPGVLAGYPIVYDTATVIGGMFVEVIAPGAAARAVREDDVRLLVNHNRDLLLARTRSGTLGLSGDQRGVAMRAELPDTPTAREVWTLVGRGDLSQGSMAFLPVRESWYPPSKERDGLPLVVIEDLKLFDVSVVAFPAYETTTVATVGAEPRFDLDGKLLRLDARLSGRGAPYPPASIRARVAELPKVRQRAFGVRTA